MYTYIYRSRVYILCIHSGINAAPPAHQAALPSVPPDTKLSKLDVLLLATNYITQLSDTLQRGGASQPSTALRPVKVSLAGTKRTQTRR